MNRESSFKANTHAVAVSFRRNIPSLTMFSGFRSKQCGSECNGSLTVHKEGPVQKEVLQMQICFFVDQMMMTQSASVVGAASHICWH